MRISDWSADVCSSDLIEASALRHKVEAASQAERVASTQAAELRRLVSQLESQLVELAKQRDTALASTADDESERQAADNRLRELQDAAQSEDRQSTRLTSSH